MKTDLQKHYEKIYAENPVAEIDDKFYYYRRNVVLDKLYPETSNKNILDIGAGSGAISKFFKNRGYSSVAIEWTDFAADKLEEAGIQTIRHDVENIPFPIETESFDEVFWGDNIEHLFAPEKTAKEIFRIVRHGGRLVLSTPNHGWIVNRMYYAIKGIPRKTEGHEADIWNWMHIRYFNKKEIVRFLKKCGFERITVYGTDQRMLFERLSEFFPSLFSSVLVVEAYKG